MLTEGGLNVVMLEAGPRLDPDKDFKEHVWPYQLPHRGVGIGGRQRGIGNEFMAPNGFWDIHGEPYTAAPGSSFRWFRSRIEGGRTNHWGRIALRFGPADFRAHSTDGMGDDWPITYEELAPYYDKVESYIGVFGSKENVPNAPDGVFLPPPKPRCTETLVKKACDQAEYHLHSLAPCNPHQGIEWSRSLPLLRAVRSRMQNRLELQFQPGDDSARPGNGPPHDDCQRDGARNCHWSNGKVEAVSYIDKSTNQRAACLR